jgi:hypothetical protein
MAMLGSFLAMLVFLIMLVVYADYAGWLPGRTVYARHLGVTLSKLAGYFGFVAGSLDMLAVLPSGSAGFAVWLSGYAGWLLTELVSVLNGFVRWLSGSVGWLYMLGARDG